MSLGNAPSRVYTCLYIYMYRKISEHSREFKQTCGYVQASKLSALILVNISKKGIDCILGAACIITW